MGVLPGAEPFAADGGEVGVVLSHGFTGSPQSLRPWAEHLSAAGLTVRLPRLPGHGTRWQDLSEGASATEVTEVILEDSFHVATLDHDAPTIFAGSLEFVRSHTSAPAAG